MPYGLFFLGHHWYLAAKDSADGPVKNFRVSRIATALMNEQKPGVPDYDIPTTLPTSPSTPARARRGSSATRPASRSSCASRARAVPPSRPGGWANPSPSDADSRRFQVRRLDVFARWLLSFAGEAEPVAPPELVDAYRALAEQTLATYAGTP